MAVDVILIHASVREHHGKKFFYLDSVARAMIPQEILNRLSDPFNPDESLQHPRMVSDDDKLVPPDLQFHWSNGANSGEQGLSIRVVGSGGRMSDGEWVRSEKIDRSGDVVFVFANHARLDDGSTDPRDIERLTLRKKLG